MFYFYISGKLNISQLLDGFGSLRLLCVCDIIYTGKTKDDKTTLVTAIFCYFQQPADDIYFLTMRVEAGVDVML